MMKRWKKGIMLYIKPDYYNKFKCTADKCEATCCAGWQIVIDEDSLERYEKEQSAYGEVLRDRVDWEEGVFKQDDCKRCAFLNPDNLCDMYKRLGEESLCMTCTNYPRHIEEFENVREITLAISCPEVARIILGQTKPVTFFEEEVEVGGEEEEFEDFDPFFFSYLEDARKILMGILQNRTLNISVRMALVQSLAVEMQEIIENVELFEVAELFEKYEDESFLAKSVSEIMSQIKAFYKDESNAYHYSKGMFGRLYELEHLSDDWETYLEECWELLYSGKAAGYQACHEDFKRWCIHEGMSQTGDTGLPDFDLNIILEQLLVYFVFTYFCGAVYDNNVLGKVMMSLASVYNIYEMCVAKWIKQGQTLTRHDIERIVYRYSRELEHSDMNLELMEETRP